MSIQQISKVSGTPNLAVKDAKPDVNGQLNNHSGALVRELDFTKVENQLLS